jgi:hypothetical protein
VFNFGTKKSAIFEECIKKQCAFARAIWLRLVIFAQIPVVAMELSNRYNLDILNRAVGLGNGQTVLADALEVKGDSFSHIADDFLHSSAG